MADEYDFLKSIQPRSNVRAGADAAINAAVEGVGSKIGGFLAAAGPWFQAAAFAFDIFSSVREKEKARRAQYQQVEITERSETHSVVLAYGRCKVSASVVIDRLSNQYTFRKPPDGTEGFEEFVVPGDNDNDARFGNDRAMAGNIGTVGQDGISFNEFLLMQYHLCDAGEGGIEEVVDLDVDGTPWNSDAFKYGQRIHVQYQRDGAKVAEPLATANGVPSTNVFAKAAYLTGVFRLNVNPHDGGSRGFYPRPPPVDGYGWWRRIKDITEGPRGTFVDTEGYAFTPNSMLVLYDLLTQVGRFPSRIFDLESAFGAKTVNAKRLDDLLGTTLINENLSATDRVITVSDSSVGKVGEFWMVDAEIVEINRIDGVNWIVTRARQGTKAAAHPNGSVLRRSGFDFYRNGRVWAKQDNDRPWLLDSVPEDWTAMSPYPAGATTIADVGRLYLRFEQNIRTDERFTTPPTEGEGIFAARGHYWKFDWSDVVSGQATVGDGESEAFHSYTPGATNVPVRLIALSDISLAYDDSGAASTTLRGLQESENAYVRRAEKASEDESAAPTLGEFNGWFDPFTPLREMVRQVLLTMPWTKMVWSSGRLKFPTLYPVTQKEEDELVVLTLNDADLFDIEKHYAPQDNAFNQVSITYNDEEQNGAETTHRWPKEGSEEHKKLLTADGGRRSDLAVQLLGMSDPYHGDIIGEYRVKHSRSVPVYRIAASLKAYRLEPWELIDVYSKELRVGTADRPARMAIIDVTLGTFGDVSAMFLTCVHYDFRNNPAAMIPQSDARPPAGTRAATFRPSNFAAMLDETARVVSCTWNDANIARWSIEVIRGDGDLTANAAFLARTDFKEAWSGRDNEAVLPLPNSAQTWRLRLRGITTQGVYTRSSNVQVIHFDKLSVNVSAATRAVELWYVAPGRKIPTVPGIPQSAEVSAEGVLTKFSPWLADKPAYDFWTDTLWKLSADRLEAGPVAPDKWTREVQDVGDFTNIWWARSAQRPATPADFDAADREEEGL